MSLSGLESLFHQSRYWVRHGLCEDLRAANVITAAIQFEILRGYFQIHFPPRAALPFPYTVNFLHHRLLRGRCGIRTMKTELRSLEEDLRSQARVGGTALIHKWCSEAKALELDIFCYFISELYPSQSLSYVLPPGFSFSIADLTDYFSS